MMLTSNNTDEQDEEDLWALLSFTLIWTLRTPNDMALQLPDLPVWHTLWIWTYCLCFLPSRATLPFLYLFPIQRLALGSDATSFRKVSLPRD